MMIVLRSNMISLQWQILETKRDCQEENTPTCNLIFFSCHIKKEDEQDDFGK